MRSCACAWHLGFLSSEGLITVLPLSTRDQQGIHWAAQKNAGEPKGYTVWLSVVHIMKTVTKVTITGMAAGHAIGGCPTSLVAASLAASAVSCSNAKE